VYRGAPVARGVAISVGAAAVRAAAAGAYYAPRCGYYRYPPCYKALVAVIERSVTAALITAAEPVSAAQLATLHAGAARVHGLEILLNPSRTISGWGQTSRSDLDRSLLYADERTSSGQTRLIRFVPRTDMASYSIISTVRSRQTQQD
jgi:hypothetical protein